MVGPHQHLSPRVADSSTATCLARRLIIIIRIIIRIIAIVVVKGRDDPGEVEA